MKVEVGRPRWSEIVIGLAIFAVSLVPLALLVGLFEDRPVLQGVLGSTAGGLAGLAGFAAAVRWRIRAWRPFGFRPVALRWLVLAVGMGFLGYGLNLIIQATFFAWIGGNDPQGILHAAARGGALPFLASLLGGAVLTPFGEEVLFRGVVANALNRHGAWAGVGLSAIIFGLAHGVSVILPVAIMVGVLAGLLFRRTGSVWPCVVLHGVYNAINSVASALGAASP